VKLTIDTDAATVAVEEDGTTRTLRLATAEAFELVSDAWLRAGWDVKHVYSFTWLGRPIIQLPEDMFRLQEVVWRLRPDVIVEIGVAHGGALVFYAGLCRVMGKGRVIGVDVEFRRHNRAAIEAHDLSPYIALIEADSCSSQALAAVEASIGADEQVLVLLDGSHTKEHVLAELDAYAPLVSPGSYIVVMDGIMGMLVGAPRSRPDWGDNNPREAAREWVARHPEFEIAEPEFAFNEGAVRRRVTYWPDGFLRRLT
jgi:cephalosporin hydroxylase